MRSLAYFQPVIEELRANPVLAGYLEYLRLKLRNLIDDADPATVQKPHYFQVIANNGSGFSIIPVDFREVLTIDLH